MPLSCCFVCAKNYPDETVSAKFKFISHPTKNFENGDADLLDVISLIFEYPFRHCAEFHAVVESMRSWWEDEKRVDYFCCGECSGGFSELYGAFLKVKSLLEESSQLSELLRVWSRKIIEEGAEQYRSNVEERERGKRFTRALPKSSERKIENETDNSDGEIGGRTGEEDGNFARRSSRVKERCNRNRKDYYHWSPPSSPTVKIEAPDANEFEEENENEADYDFANETGMESEGSNEDPEDEVYDPFENSQRDGGDDDVKRPFVCKVQGCGWSFKIRKQLTRHMRVHTEGQNFTCPVNNCGCAYRRKDNLQVHMRKKHKRKLTKEEYLAILKRIKERDGSTFSIDLDKVARRSDDSWKGIQDPSNPFACLLCKKVVSSKSDLVRHFIAHDTARPFACKICERRFKRQDHLKGHLRTHSETLVETIYGEYPGSRSRKVETQRSPDTEEIDEVSEEAPDQDGRDEVPEETPDQDGTDPDHNEIPGHSCSECGKLFSKRIFLVKHIAMSHSKPKGLFSCPDCGKSFSNGDTLAEHLVHHRTTPNTTRDEGISSLAPKPYVCEMKDCGKAFSSKPLLVSHERTHPGLRDYACKYCGHPFKRKDNLLQHLRRVHEKRSKVARMGRTDNPI